MIRQSRTLFFRSGAALLLLLLSGIPLGAQGGGGAVAFLQRPVGVAGISLGGAFTSVASDPSALFWNPAGITQSQHFRAMTSYAILTLDQRQNFVGATMPILPLVSFGAGWVNYSVDAIDRRDDTGAKIGEFSSSDNAFILSIARKFPFRNRASMSIGASGKYLYSSLAGYYASGTAFDVGGFLDFEHLSFGLSMSNIGGGIRWDALSKRYDRVPFTFRSGVSYEFGFGQLRGTTLRVSMEGVKTQTQTALFVAGVEGRMELGIPRTFTAVRAGYANGLFAGGLSFGVNIDKNVGVEMQYAASEDYLTTSLLHHIGILFQF